jgi:uncharacterized protein (TIGR03118 family)
VRHQLVFGQLLHSVRQLRWGRKSQKNSASRRMKLSVAVVCTLLLAPVLASAQEYVQTNLVTDLSTSATFTNDTSLKNPWGLTRSVSSPWWVSDNNAGVATVYDGTGAKHLTVVIPGPNGTTPCPVGGPITPTCFVSAPTGMVSNGTSEFDVTPGKPASFIFDTEDGTISAWNGGTVATLKVDNSANPTAADGAVYKGLTIGDCKGTPYLYATNFRAGRVEVYDTSFNQVHLSDDCKVDKDVWKHDEESFDDDRIPRGFAPFNIQNIGNSLFVTYAKQDASKHDDVAGAGLGFVDVYSTSGKLLTRFEHGPWLNSPWGVVWAPRDFGEFSNNILVGNFGGGQIAAYDGFTGTFIGLMEDQNSKTLTIDGLWSLTFGNSAVNCPTTVPVTVPPTPKCNGAGPYNSLFFTAGPNGENDGLFGTLTPIMAELDEGDEL